MVYFWILLCLAAAALLFYLAPLFHTKKPVLPILLMGKIGKPNGHSKDKTPWLSAKSLERLLAKLYTQHFQSVLPKDILSGKSIPTHSVLLLFHGGYQSFYTLVFPLLKKYNMKAACALPVEHIGRYDAWQSPQEGPWQPLLTEEQIRQLHKSGRVEFISQTLNGSSLNAHDEEIAVWMLTESRTRLANLYKIKTRSVYFPQENPHQDAVLAAAKQTYDLLIGNISGNNLLPLAHAPLRVFPVTARTLLTRLFWKMQ